MGSPISGIPGLDKREDYRARYIAAIEIESGRAKLRGRTYDISLGGANVEVEKSVPAGAEIKLHVPVDQGPPLALACVVKNAGGGMIGVEFLDLTPDDRQRLRKLLERLPH